MPSAEPVASIVPDPGSASGSASAARVDDEAPIHLALHGLPTLSIAGAAVRLERKQAALLAYLQHAGSTPRSRLADLLWPGATASGARGNLRQCLARLRRLAPHLLLDLGDALGLSPRVLVDEPDDARAELLAGCDYADCDDFSRWLRARVDAERTARQAALAIAARDALDRADFAEAQARADALLSLDGESEDAHRLLMEVAYRRGDFSAAVRFWDRCRDMLRELYGVTPSTATQALGASITAAAAPSEQRVATGAFGPGNLGASLPVLYGREADLAALLPALLAHRLVTLLGIGGVGKTTLALAAAHAEQARWPDGVWFVDLAPVSDAVNLPAAIAQVLGLGLPAHRDPVDDLVRAVRSSAMLLVLDNAEHLCEAVAVLAAALLAGTSNLRLLVTSRQALRVPQEQRFRLAGLSASPDADLSDRQRSGALALFEARVAALDARFRLTADNTAAVAEVCWRLDGLPLAIELAAARVPVLGVENLRARLRRDLAVMGGQPTIGSPRHQTLRAMLDWTHALLTVDEQRLLRRLGIFVGGFTFELAEQVACASLDAVDHESTWASLSTSQSTSRASERLVDDLSALIEKSLVTASNTDPPRYRLLEVTRAYALEKMTDAGELARVSALHAHAVARLFASAEIALNDTTRGALTRGAFLDRLTPELDNLRAARAFSAASASSRTLSVGLAATSTEALRLLGLSTEALRAIADVRELVDATVPDDTAELFWTALCALGTHGRLSKTEMLAVIDHAERLYRRVGSPRRIHFGLYRKGFALLHLGLVDEAQRAVTEMSTLEAPELAGAGGCVAAQPAGAVDAVSLRFDDSIAAFRHAAALLAFERGEADVVLNVLGNLCMSLLGAQRHEEALAVAADILSRAPSPVVRNLAQRAMLVAMTFLGRLDEAGAVAKQAMPGWINDDMLPHMLSVFAWLAYLQGRVVDAFRLDGHARAQVARMGLSNSPVFDRARAHLEAAIARDAVPAADVSRWQGEGERLGADDVIALCIGRDPRDTALAS